VKEADMRSVRWLAVWLVGALVLAACPADPVPEEAAECEPGETDGDLALFNWSDYLDPDLVDQFEEEHGVSVTQDEFTSNEELLARIQAGGAGYDVIVPSDYMVEIMIELDLLMPLNHDAIPNIDNLGDFFRDVPFDAGNRYSAGYQWGTTGLGVNVERIEEALGEVPHTWGLVFDPEIASNFRGQISMLDDARETVGAALIYLGYDINTTDEGELQEARDLIREARQNIATFTSLGYADLLAAGETTIGHGFSGDLLLAIEDSEAGELDYIIPDEGGVVWVDNMAIPHDAPSPCTAHAFINFILDAEVGAALSNWVWYASPNAAAEPMIDEEVLSVYPDDELLEELLFIEDVGEATPLYEQYFTEAKS
jgi:spermidine/putrescine transport system substrate-binding protein